MFYDVFKRLCDEKGVSCNRAATEIGLSNATATKWTKTGATPSGDTLSKIAVYFDVSIDVLLGNEEKPAVAADDELNEILEDVRRNPELRAMFSITKKATPEQVRQYIKVIKALRGGDDDE